MSKSSKVLFSALLGCFFCLATLEIDVCDHDNTYFDSYDSYIKFDSKITHKILDIGFDRFATAEIILPPILPSLFRRTSIPVGPCSSNCFYRPKLFLIKSSLII